MQNLFVNENDEFIIRFTVATDDKGTIFCDTNRESLIESFKDKVKELEIKDYEAVFRKPSFGDSIELYDSIFSVNNGADVSFNPVLIRSNKIIALIKSWNLQGEKNKPTAEDIKKLHPTIATVIGVLLDQETGAIFG